MILHQDALGCILRSIFDLESHAYLHQRITALQTFKTAQSTFSKSVQPHFSYQQNTPKMSPILCRPIRPLLAQSNKRWLGTRLSSTAAKHHEPLRVLFCGADAFSIYSLRALHKLQQANPEKIASIDVVCRPDKRVGRGLKKIQEGSYI